MRLASGTVLGLAALASSPALWAGFQGQLAVDVALSRYLVAVGIVWAALSFVSMLVGTAPRPTPEEPLGSPSDAAEGPGDTQPLV